jgi:hypothetical protein
VVLVCGRRLCRPSKSKLPRGGAFFGTLPRPSIMPSSSAFFYSNCLCICTFCSKPFIVKKSMGRPDLWYSCLETSNNEGVFASLFPPTFCSTSASLTQTGETYSFNTNRYYFILHQVLVYNSFAVSLFSTFIS